MRDTEHLDVLVIGAGLSGIAAAHHLQAECPGRAYAILEARDAIGGTWDLFRYPGVRSDSDMFTLGYPFRPWTAERAIADGPSILRYIRETAREDGTDAQIRFGHRVQRASWSTAEQRWIVEAQRTDTSETVRMTAGFVFGCTGYYRYDAGYTPDLPGIETFGGEVVHPQHWPEDLDHTGKRVLIVGSGATAVTLVPALAGDAAHVTMLQRSPSYVISLPSTDPLAALARRVLPARLVPGALRWKSVVVTLGHYGLSRRLPRFMRRVLVSGVRKALPEGYDVGTHFSPAYDPWDQRLCIVPDGDLFRTIRRGQASVVTDRIATFDETGVVLASGRRVDADVVITATGLELLALGGVELSVDGREVEAAETLTYRGMMLAGVPNLAIATGYTNASWTLKADLICRYVTRLLNHMEAHGHTQATPRAPADAGPTEPFLNLTSGYIVRGGDRFPRQGARAPWRTHHNYFRDLGLIRRGDVAEGMEFAS